MVTSPCLFLLDAAARGPGLKGHYEAGAYGGEGRPPPRKHTEEQRLGICGDGGLMDCFIFSSGILDFYCAF